MLAEANDPCALVCLGVSGRILKLINPDDEHDESRNRYRRREGSRPLPVRQRGRAHHEMGAEHDDRPESQGDRELTQSAVARAQRVQRIGRAEGAAGNPCPEHRRARQWSAADRVVEIQAQGDGHREAHGPRDQHRRGRD